MNNNNKINNIMRQECIDLINKTGKFATLKRLYSSISGSTVEEFVSNASDAQVEVIIKLCKKELKIN